MTISRPDDGSPLVDPRVDRAWREISREEPGASLDAALLAAAHRDAGAKPQPLGGREARAARRQWWPLAAAATVAAIAVGVLQLTPREELGAPSAEKAVVSDMPAPVAKVAPQSALPAAPVDEMKPAGGNDAPTRKETSRADASRRPAMAPSAPEPRRQAAAPVQVPPPLAEPFPGAPKLAAKAAEAPAAPLAESAPPQDAPRSPAAAGNVASQRAAPARDAGASAETVAAPPMAPAPRTEAAAPASRTFERASAAPAPAPLAKMVPGRGADTATGDARIKDRAPLPIPDWIALIRRLRDEGKSADAAKELAAFRAAHLDHEKLLPPDLRDWRPPEK